MEFSYDGLYIWKTGRSYLAGFKDIWLTMTPRSMKGIPEHSVQCPLDVGCPCSAPPVSRTSQVHVLCKILREPLLLLPGNRQPE